MKKVFMCFSLCAVLALSGCGKTDKKLDDANKKINQLSDKIDDLVELMNDNIAGEEVHDIYDDTAVVEAYKNDDASKLDDEKDKYILEQAKKAIKSNIKDSMTDYEKEKAIYDYMFKMTSFDKNSLAAIPSSGEYAHTPYGFFKNHSTICVGNATTFKLFMDMLGIECKIIHSTENGEHAWDIVKLDDGWYHVDLTFDNVVTGKPSYSFFNVNDDAKNNGDYPWDTSAFPKCDATKYSYPYNESVAVKSVYDIPAQIKKAIDKKLNSIFLKLTVPEKTDAKTFKQQVYDTLSYIQSDKYMISVSMSMIADKDKSVIFNITIVYPDDYSGNSDNNKYNSSQSIVDYNKMQEKFSDVFDGEVGLLDEEKYDY